jgi:hypothetical protein
MREVGGPAEPIVNVVTLAPGYFYDFGKSHVGKTWKCSVRCPPRDWDPRVFLWPKNTLTLDTRNHLIEYCLHKILLGPG